MKKVLAITGPSGSGKSTISYYLKDNYGYEFARHTTTREKREDDYEGFYNYISVDKFKDLIEEGAFLFYSSYKERYYGILKKDFLDLYSKNDNIIIHINYMDLDQIKEIKDKYNIQIIQLNFKDIETTLRKRIESRGQEESEINYRIEIALLNQQIYENKLNEYVDVVCYTDDMSFEEEKKYIVKEIGKYYDSKRNKTNFK